MHGATWLEPNLSFPAPAWFFFFPRGVAGLVMTSPFLSLLGPQQGLIHVPTNLKCYIAD